MVGTNDKSVVVTVTGDASQLKKEFDRIKKQTASLESALSSVAKTSAIAFAGLTAAIVGVTKAYREDEQAQIRTIQTIKATGGAAGLAAEEIFQMASALQDVTTFGDEAVLQASNLLLTFRNIGREVFPRATEAILDMSTAMDVGIKEASIQLGKALNDPILGISALTRVGIQFTEEQKGLIKEMVRTNDIAGAQGVILAELENQFGGVARAAAQGTGKFIQLNNVIGDIFEQMGKAAVEVLAPFVEKLTELAKAVRDNETFGDLSGRILVYSAAVAGAIGITATLGLGLIAVRKTVLLATAAFRIFGITASTAWAKATLGLSLIIVGIVELVMAIRSMDNPLRNIQAGFEFMSNQVQIQLNNVKIVMSELIAKSKDLGASILEAIPGDAFKEKIASLRDSAQIYREITNEILAENMRLNQSFGEVLAGIPIEQKLEKNEENFQKELEQRAEQEQRRLDQEAEFRARRDEIEEEIKQIKLELELEENEYERQRLEARLSELQGVRDEFLSQEEKKANQTKDRIEARDRKHKEALKKAEEQLAKEKIKTDLTVANSAISLGESIVKSGTAASKAVFLARKAFAIAEILINGQQAASLAIATIPPPFGEAVAAQRVAQSFVQAALVGATAVTGFSGAQDGALVGGSGRRFSGDRRPFMLEDGELIVPKRNFEEVVDATARARGFEKAGESSLQSSPTRVEIELKGEAAQFITARQYENNILGTDRT